MAPDLSASSGLDDIVLPELALTIAHGRPCVPVWRNENGGVTFAIGADEEYLKIETPGPDWDVAGELARLAWVSPFVPAPEPLGHGATWLHTLGLPGTSAVAAQWRARPEIAVPELGRALRHFHNTVPAQLCPFSWSVSDRVSRFGLDDTFLSDPPTLDQVVCHGDACNPNFLLDADGQFSGYVDLGSLGVADRWADLAPALLSLGWNYGAGWEATFLQAYGLADDPPKRGYYTALWNGVATTLRPRS